MNTGGGVRNHAVATTANNVRQKTFRPKATAEGIPPELTDYIGSEIDGAVDYVGTEIDSLDERIQPLEQWYNKHIANRTLATRVLRDLPHILVAIAALVSLAIALHIIKVE